MKWKRNVDGRVVRGGDREEYVDVTEELTKQGWNVFSLDDNA